MESLDHITSEKMVKLSQKRGISLKSLMLSHNVPPLNSRQWKNLVNLLIINLLRLNQQNSSHLLLGFNLDVSTKLDQVWGPSGDKHAVVISLNSKRDTFYLDFFDVNGKLKPKSLRFDDMIKVLLKRLQVELKSKLEREVIITEVNPYYINFGKGHCDLFSLIYINLRNSLSYQELCYKLQQIKEMNTVQKQNFLKLNYDKLLDKFN